MTGVTLNATGAAELAEMLQFHAGWLQRDPDCLRGAPHIVPVGFRLDAEAATIEIGGHGLSKSKKWRDLQANPHVAFAVDDLASVNPWTPRGIEIRGRAQLHDRGGEERFGGGGWDSAWFSIVPQRIISWGIEA
jgi:pyridoxamine 5'-phosphate oxidase family protein